MGNYKGSGGVIRDVGTTFPDAQQMSNASLRKFNVGILCLLLQCNFRVLRVLSMPRVYSNARRTNDACINA